ncbi:hypothetical protein VZ95_06365 [Elstera litoralis]|uniref:Uncharacterized protein n=1 Tax=Elstera litoralis TaxID=552518 RepID=A0A0F3IXB5_9PROT|nr:hypothetical protein [Elstera litoralis]KJV10234.1 hypothetical protein VZ95_06365 [Elstera litoralis]
MTLIMAFLWRLLRRGLPCLGVLMLAGLLLSSCARKPDDLFRACAALTGAFEPIGETIIRALPEQIGPLSVRIAWRWGEGQTDALTCHFADRAKALENPPYAPPRPSGAGRCRSGS